MESINEPHPKCGHEEYRAPDRYQETHKAPVKEASKSITDIVLISCAYVVSIVFGVHVPIMLFRLFNVKESVFKSENWRWTIAWIILSYIFTVILLVPCGAVFLKYRYFVKKAAQLSLIYPLVKKYLK